MHIEILDKPDQSDPINQKIVLRVHHNGVSKLIDVDGYELDDIVRVLGSQKTKQVLASLSPEGNPCL